MLTVYFIKAPVKNNDPGDDPNTTPTTGRLEVLSTMRLTIKNERNEKINYNNFGYSIVCYWCQIWFY